MNLRSLLALVRGLGKLRVTARGGVKNPDDATVALAACEVLRDWPSNFLRLMSDFADRSGNKAESAAAKQFAPIHRAVFRNKAIEPGNQTDFLKTTFVEFLVNKWGKTYVDHKLLRHVHDSSERRYLCRSEFAAKMGIQQTTAARLLQSKAIPSKRVKCGNAERVIVDSAAIPLPQRSAGAVLRCRAAAKRLGLPVSVLVALRGTGHFEVRHLPPTRTGWHERDVEAFEQKILKAAKPSPSQVGNMLALSAIMQNSHHSPALKADVVRGLLAEEITGRRLDGRGIESLLVEASSFDRWLRTICNQQMANARTPYEAARELQCDKGCIGGLLQMGLLRGTKTCVGLRIDYDSILAFKQEYGSLVSYANQFKTSTRGLMARCKGAGIELLSVPLARRAGPQPFIRIADAVTIL